MNIRRLTVMGFVPGLILSLSLCGCEADTVSNARYTTPESIEYQDWSTNQNREVVDVISQAYNRETGVINGLISNQLKTRDSDIESMNEKYSFWQNTTSQR